MNGRPVWRWKSFWLGVLVLCFLGWVWVRSMDREEGVSLFGVDELGGSAWGLGVITITSSGGIFSASQEETISAGHFVVEWFSGPFHQEEAPRRKWALLSNEELDHGGKRTWWIAFPTWIPLAGHVLVWGAWLAWRWRRVRRCLTEWAAGMGMEVES